MSRGAANAARRICGMLRSSGIARVVLYYYFCVWCVILTGCATQAPCPPPPPSRFACDASAFLRADAAQQTSSIIRWSEEWAAGRFKCTTIR